MQGRCRILNPQNLDLKPGTCVFGGLGPAEFWRACGFGEGTGVGKADGKPAYFVCLLPPSRGPSGLDEDRTGMQRSEALRLDSDLQRIDAGHVFLQLHVFVSAGS